MKVIKSSNLTDLEFMSLSERQFRHMVSCKKKKQKIMVLVVRPGKLWRSESHLAERSERNRISTVVPSGEKRNRFASVEIKG